MAGTKDGARKGIETLKKTKGNNFLKERAAKAGSKGAKDGVIKGYAANPELAKEAGRKGAAVRWGNK